MIVTIMVVGLSLLSAKDKLTPELRPSIALRVEILSSMDLGQPVHTGGKPADEWFCDIRANQFEVAGPGRTAR